VLLDIRFGLEDNRLGFEILLELTRQFPSIPVLMMSSVERDIDSLGRCLEEGAIGFIAKGLPRGDLQRACKQALATARSHALLGHSKLFRELRRQAARLSPYDQIPVLIVGPRGSGKERVARYIHQNGPRSSGPFIAVNCGGLTESLLESELFGSEKGAYTGAITTRLGYCEMARDGILFLDEIGNMPIATQAMLLRVLQDKTFRRVGITEREITADFQIIGSTNVEPEDLIRSGRLREDFYDRIAAVTVRTPNLKDCREDIPELVNHFLHQLDLQSKKRISAEAMSALLNREWPGNVRELRRVLQEAVVRSESSPVVAIEHLPRQERASTLQIDPPSHQVKGGASAEPASTPAIWSEERILSELRLAIQAKREIQKYKGKHWKAEFMRLMYPECKAANAKGVNDLVRRLTKGPWGDSKVTKSHEASSMLKELQD
jgi:DNA-binding NtrC family response regulator